VVSRDAVGDNGDLPSAGKPGDACENRGDAPVRLGSERALRRHVEDVRDLSGVGQGVWCRLR
jgi:hypothetical protein